MDQYLLLLIAVSLVGLCWRFIFVPWFTSKGVSPVLLATITAVVAEAVAFAEQMYKQDSDIERKAVAYQAIYDMLEAMYIDPVPLAPVIEYLIEAAVSRLPKTHQ